MSRKILIVGAGSSQAAVLLASLMVADRQSSLEAPQLAVLTITRREDPPNVGCLSSWPFKAGQPQPWYRRQRNGRPSRY